MQLSEVVEFQKKQITDLKNQRDIATLDPVFELFVDAMNTMNTDVKDGNAFATEHDKAVKSEISGLREEMQELKLDIETSKSTMGELKEGGEVLNTGLEEIKYSLEFQSNSIISEISRLRETISMQSESNQAMLLEMRADIKNNTVSNAVIDSTSKKLDEIDDKVMMICEIVEDMKALMDTTRTSKSSRMIIL
jgi:hypothetical protein